MTTQARRDREKQLRRAAIIDAAEQVFLRSGVRHATMEEVADAAEVGKGTVYLYFKSKDTLFLEVSLRVLGGLAQRIAEVESAGVPIGRYVESIVVEYVSFASTHPDHFRMAIDWLTSPRAPEVDAATLQRWQSVVDDILTHISTALERGIESGTVRSNVEPVRVARQMWAATAGGLLLSLFSPRTLEDTGEDTPPVESFAELLTKGISVA